MDFKAQIEKFLFERYILDVAITTLEKGGSASRPETFQFLQPTDVWRFPKYPGKTVILPPDADLLEGIKQFIELNQAHLQESDCWLGTWINPHSKHCYLDISTSRSDLEDSRQAALAISEKEGRKIVAMYNSKLEQTVYLGDDFRGE